jgi:hypothetical protein
VSDKEHLCVIGKNFMYIHELQEERDHKSMSYKK